jgi:hypothetical protein
MKPKKPAENFVIFLTITAFILCLLPQHHFADMGKGHLRGYLYKKDAKTPQWGSQVLLENARTGKIHESNVTDTTGDYTISNIPAGDYTIGILYKDKPYKIKKIDFLIKIMDGKTSNLSFALKKTKTGLFFLKPCVLAVIFVGIAVIAFIIKR